MKIQSVKYQTNSSNNTKIQNYPHPVNFSGISLAQKLVEKKSLPLLERFSKFFKFSLSKVPTGIEKPTVFEKFDAVIPFEQTYYASNNTLFKAPIKGTVFCDGNAEVESHISLGAKLASAKNVRVNVGAKVSGVIESKSLDLYGIISKGARVYTEDLLAHSFSRIGEGSEIRCKRIDDDFNGILDGFIYTEQCSKELAEKYPHNIIEHDAGWYDKQIAKRKNK